MCVRACVVFASLDRDLFDAGGAVFDAVLAILLYRIHRVRADRDLCVCVCVCERERERERETDIGIDTDIDIDTQI